MSLFRRAFKVPSLDESKNFYTNLVVGETKRGLWGKEQRFDPLKHLDSENFKRHFYGNVRNYIRAEDSVLDFGCGSGMFLVHLAKLCHRLIGVDISKSLIKVANSALEKLKLDNAQALEVQPGRSNFADASFDKVVAVDVIHHLDDIPNVVHELHRLLKPGGQLLIFEPNKLNPALFLMCVFDGNEWGLLSLGTKKSYKRILSSHFRIVHFSFCGLLIGPDSKLAFAIADFLLKAPYAALLKYFSPKVFIVAEPL